MRRHSRSGRTVLALSVACALVTISGCGPPAEQVAVETVYVEYQRTWPKASKVLQETRSNREFHLARLELARGIDVSGRPESFRDAWSNWIKAMATHDRDKWWEAVNNPEIDDVEVKQLFPAIVAEEELMKEFMRHSPKIAEFDRTVKEATKAIIEDYSERD